MKNAGLTLKNEDMSMFKLTCKEATLLSVKKEEQGLPPWINLKLAMHLKNCGPCKRFIEQSLLIQKGISQYLSQTNHHLSAEIKQAIQHRIDQES